MKRIFWLEYFHAGRRFRESSESESEQVATKLLKKRLADTGQGKVVGSAEEKVRFEDLADGVLNEYRLKGYRSLEAAEIHIRKLRTFFGTGRQRRKTASLYTRETAPSISRRTAYRLSCSPDKARVLPTRRSIEKLLYCATLSI